MGCSCKDAADLMTAVDAVCAHGVAYKTDGDYPFPEDRCNTRSLYAVKQRIQIWDQTNAMNALATIGPFASEMTIDPSFLSLRKGTIYRYQPTTEPRLHSVAVIGFNREQEFWIIANSFGPNWGDSGFGRVAFDSKAPMGEGCGWQFVV
jgi:C1A family cysteine protease